VREQVDLFQRATHVIGCHGAGLTNILFCNPGTIVIEILNICYATPAYALIAQELGLNYQYVCGAPDDVELSEEIAAKQNHRPDLGNQNFHILPTTVEKICEFLDRPSKDNITEKEKVMPTPDKPLRKSVEMLRSTIAGCRTDVVIGILDDANQVILSTLCLLALDPSLPKFEIYPVNSTITDLLPSPLNQMTTALSLLNTDSKYEISVVIGPKLSVAKIREFAPPSARFAANCAALVWDKDFNPFNDVITKRRLSDLCPLTTPLSSRSLPYEAHISAHIKANGDYVSFYKDKTVQQVPSAIPFLIDLANKEKCTTIIEIGTGNGGLSQAFADYTRSKIVTLDIENKAQHLINYSDRVTYLVTDAHQDSTVDLLSSLRNDGKLLLLIDGGDKSREFNHLKGLLQEDDLIMVHDFAPTKDDFEEVKRSKTWLWHESSEDCLDLQGLQKYPGYSLIWKHFVWGAFYKA
jgi:hypothetical protein